MTPRTTREGSSSQFTSTSLPPIQPVRRHRGPNSKDELQKIRIQAKLDAAGVDNHTDDSRVSEIIDSEDEHEASTIATRKRELDRNLGHDEPAAKKVALGASNGPRGLGRWLMNLYQRKLAPSPAPPSEQSRSLSITTSRTTAEAAPPSKQSGSLSMSTSRTTAEGDTHIPLQVIRTRENISPATSVSTVFEDDGATVSNTRSVVRIGSILTAREESVPHDQVVQEWNRRNQQAFNDDDGESSIVHQRSGYARQHESLVDSSSQRSITPTPQKSKGPTKLELERQRVNEARRRLPREDEGEEVSYPRDVDASKVLGIDTQMIADMTRNKGGRPSKRDLYQRELMADGWSGEQMQQELERWDKEQSAKPIPKRIRHYKKQERRPTVAWTKAEIQRLVVLWYQHGNSWALIKRIDDSSPDPQLLRRTQVDLKDKKRQIEGVVNRLRITIPQGFGTNLLTTNQLEDIASELGGKS
ncbi:hypothetical protein N7494_001465 [Penicillium frequentans]|uniref:Myb-like domain-containing protein n=1 Tax=Penicillium frequentans TaxID=3151616 RepID=A0AAD6GH30_9EURO|nr:hypothetical protein N7494_008416 [Penicillium glabrum]KAJ5552087.1 hypothetical protein N7494_001465 [Penicillium glabrum]